MKDELSKILASTAFFLQGMTLVAQTHNADPAFVTCSLHHRIQLDIPATWEVVGARTLEEMRNAAHAKIDLSDLPIKNLGGYEALLMVHGTTEDSFATVTVTYKFGTVPTQNEIANWTPEQVARWTSQSESELRSTANMIDGFAWQSAIRKVLGEKTFLQTSYARTHQVTGDQVVVSIYNYFDEQVVQITTTYPAQHRLLWAPITERIVSSLRMLDR